MNISILTVFEQLYESFLATSLVHRAQQKNLVSIHVNSFFGHVKPKERIDAPGFGPGAGMLIKPEVIEKAIGVQEQTHGKAFKVFFSPQGQKLTQHVARKIAARAQEVSHLMLIAGRYEGMDVRVEQEYADAVISVGDFVVMGGDVPAMLFLEAILRLVPGVVGKQESVEHESFSGPFLDYPVYTEPIEWHGKEVPEVIRSGNHGAIDNWRKQQAVKKTVLTHFDWFRTQSISVSDRQAARVYIPRHYVVLMHSDVLVGPERKPGVTSVTSIDIHDIARSCTTYDIELFFIVTPLQDQQKIVGTLLDFWQKGIGIEYNRNRHEAVDRVRVKNSLSEVLDAIEVLEGKRPVVVVTSARQQERASEISYEEQAVVWAHERPVVLLFGTGKGLAPTLVDQADYVLLPLHGLSDFNHLSVRSAVAVILDRWLGINEKRV